MARAKKAATKEEVYPKGFMGGIKRTEQVVLSFRQDVCEECNNGYLMVPVSPLPPDYDASSLYICSACGYDAAEDYDYDRPTQDVPAQLPAPNGQDATTARVEV